jgi:predicted permease
MTWWRVLIARLSGKGRTPAELDEEMAAHSALLAEEYEQRGMSPEAARAEARRQFAGATQIREQYSAQRRLPFLDTLAQDLAYALRQLRTSPGFAAAAVLTLALGIGANLAIYQVLDAVVFRDLPVRDPARLVEIQLLESNDPTRVSYPLFRELSAHQQVFDPMFAVSDFSLREVMRSGQTIQGTRGVMASGAFFHTLGVAARAGRVFTDDDDRPGAAPVAVLSDAFWKREFARSPAALGQTLQVNGAHVTIIGVTPPEFFGETLGAPPDFWVPISLQPQITPGDRLNGVSMMWLSMLGRLRPGVTARQAEAAFNPLFQQFAQLTARRTDRTYRVHARPANRGIGDLQSRFERPLWLLMAMVGLVLVMLCSNLANLLLGRAAVRTHEIGVRLALGAGRARIVRQLLTESLLLSALGLLLAIPLASRGSAGLVALASMDAGFRVQTGWREAAFALAVALVCTCLFGLAPAFAATRVDVHPALQAHRRTTASGRRRFFGNSLVIAQVSMSLVLISGAALFARSLWNLRHQNFGMNTNTIRVTLPFQLSRPAVARRQELTWPIYERMNSLAGVHSAAVCAFGPMDSLVRTISGASSPERPAQHGDSTRLVPVSPGYFETMGIPIVAGRGIADRDRAGGAPVVVLSQTAARVLFGREDAVSGMVSKSERFDSKNALQVVGVARDVRFGGAREPFGIVLYVPLAQEIAPVTSIVLWPARNAAQVAADARAALRDLDPTLKTGMIQTFGDAFDAGLGNDKLLAVIAAAFGLLALVLSCVGVYGVLSYAVERRTQEIGIRIALGAGRAAVYRMVGRQAALLIAASVVIGGAGAVAVTAALRSTLFGFAPDDYTLPLAAAGLLCLAALAASYLPARRAARLDPMEAIR